MTDTQDKQWGIKESRKLVWLAMLMDESCPTLTKEETYAMDNIPFSEWTKELQNKRAPFGAAMIG